MKHPRWIPLDAVLTLHDMHLAAFGGKAGLRDPGLLESALARPRHRFHYGRPRPSLPRLAASYAFGIVKNHPFVDGNKRTGLIVAFAFLELNGFEVRATEEDAYQVFMRLASGTLTEAALSRWLTQNSAR